MDRKKIKREKAVLLITTTALIILTLHLANADPVAPDGTDLIRNVTRNTTEAEFINISGGRIGVFNINSTVQNPRWKAFVGNVTGKFTLDDPEGATVFDWTISSITGRIYATSNYSAISWSDVNCSEVDDLEQENIRFNHTGADDNITKTFNASGTGTHNEFYVAGRQMIAHQCPTLNTYSNSNPQDSTFEEVALHDGNNVIYAALLEQGETGYSGDKYDFQMIVPEIGLPGFQGATAYYIYVEIGT